MATRSEVEMSDAEVDALLSRHETECWPSRATRPRMRSRSRTDSTRSRGPPSSGSFRRPTARSGSSSRPTRKPGSWCTRRGEGGSEEYASVVGVGTLHRVDLDDLTPETIAQYGKTQRPPCSGSGPTGRKTSTSSCTGSNLSDSPAVRSSSTDRRSAGDSSAWVEVSSIAYKWCSWIVDWLLYRPRYRL